MREAYAEASAQIGDEEYGKVVITYLGLTLSKLTDLNASLSRWKNDAEAVVNVFSRQALPMVWDYAENVSTSGKGASWTSMFERTAAAIQASMVAPQDCKIYVLRGSATRIPMQDGELSAIVTDPPYYDAIPYSDLSDFFYVWLKRGIGKFYPEHFRTPTTPKAQEAVQNPVRHNGDNQKAKIFFEDMMAQAFAEMHRVLKPSGEATIVFAHKSTEAWETLIGALIRAGFRVEASWPLRTESL